MKRKTVAIDEEFYDLIKDIKVDRIKLGTDRESKSDRRITKAMARLFKSEQTIYNSLIVSPLDDDRKMSGRKRK